MIWRISKVDTYLYDSSIRICSSQRTTLCQWKFIILMYSRKISRTPNGMRHKFATKLRMRPTRKKLFAFSLLYNTVESQYYFDHTLTIITVPMVKGCNLPLFFGAKFIWWLIIVRSSCYWSYSNCTNFSSFHYSRFCRFR